jgi:benzoate membrane transport protein
MMKYFSMSHVSAGFVAVLVGYTSAASIVYQAAAASGASPDQIASWLWALGVGMGVCGIGLSLYYRDPIVIAWSTPGAALLVTSLSGVSLSDAIGAFIACSALITLCGITGWFDYLTHHIPKSVAAAMLAGVLLRFGLAIFPAFEKETLLVGIMVVSYLLGKRWFSRLCIPLTFAIGVGMAFIQDGIDLSQFSLNLTIPVWVTPSFNWSVMIGVGLPLFIVTMASQNIPGLAILRTHGYETPSSAVISWTGICGLILAPFGGFAFNIAAITASLCMGEEVDRQKERCYLAAIWAGLFFLLAGLFGGIVAGLLGAFPSALVSTIAGLALLGTIANSLKVALTQDDEREASIITFLITGAGGTFLTIGAPFWGLVVGLIVYYVMNWAKD